MDLGLRNKVAIVTGGSDGLGLATARRLAAEGAAVAICGRDAERLARATETLRADGASVLDVHCDVTRPADLERLVSSTLERFGRIDILVNNAGTSAARAFDTVDDATWQADLELKLFGAVRCVRLCVPHMRRHGGGRIVNILNTGAKTPGARSMPTSVSRAAGLALTKALSKELAPDGILVNAVCIGVVKSAQWERSWAKEGSPGNARRLLRAPGPGAPGSGRPRRRGRRARGPGGVPGLRAGRVHHRRRHQLRRRQFRRPVARARARRAASEARLRRDAKNDLVLVAVDSSRSPTVERRLT